MALPSGLDTVTVNVGPYIKPDGTAMSGTVSFGVPGTITHIPSGAVILAEPATVTLDGSGMGTIVLPATDAAGLSLTDWAYTVTYQLGKRINYTAVVQLPKSSPVVDLDLLATTTASNGVVVAYPEVVSVDGKSGAVTLNEMTHPVTLVSSFAGGEDSGAPGTFDSTSRLSIQSYQRADVGSFGETIRHYLMRKNAKAMEAWYLPRKKDGSMKPAFNANKDVDVDPKWVPVAWCGAHWEANNGASIHGHWSVEVPDLTGAVQTRFEIPFTDQEAADADKILGVAVTNIRTNLADLSVRASGGVFRVGGGNAYNKDILLSISSDRANSGRRWAIRANTDTEAGSNLGTNFQLMRYDDAGNLLGSAVFVSRASGNVNFGGISTSNGRVAVEATTDTAGIYSTNTNGTGNVNQPHLRGDSATAASLLFSSRVTGDASSRFTQRVDGQMAWGDGTGARDTNLYRSSAATLKTDNTFQTDANLRIRTTSVGGGTGVIGIANASVSPAGTPSGGGVIYVEGGALKYKGSSGTVTTLASA